MTIQYHDNGSLQHLLSIKGLTKSTLLSLVDKAKTFANGSPPQLHGKILTTLFFEPSTRTRCSFEIAALRLGAKVIHMDIDRSSTQKGETLLDTIHNLAAMGTDLFVIRHSVDGTLENLATQLSRPIHLVNAGEGCLNHPTQALLDILTICRHHAELGRLRVA